MKKQINTSQKYRLACASLPLASVGLMCTSALAQPVLPPEAAARFSDVIGARIEALTILAGDNGLSGGTYSKDKDNADVDLNLMKFGGVGDIGDPRPLGGSVRWQPRLQGALGYLDAENQFKEGLLDHDESKYETLAVQFGGGARFWFTENFSLTPTISGMYGHTENSYDAESPFGRANKELFKDLGIIEWDVDTWTVVPGIEAEYGFNWRRTIFTLSSTFNYYHTEDFDSSSDLIEIDGDSETWRNKIDVDVPLGVELFGYELRTGGYFSRTELFDDIEDGMDSDHLYEVHGRFVLDTLNKLWKLKWIGLGGSYIWGNDFDGYAFGIDVQFKF